MRSISMSTLFSIGLAFVLACTTPTEMCGCPPSRSSVVVTGSLSDARSAALGNTLLYFEAIPEAYPNFPAAPATRVRTTTDGKFEARLYSMHSPGAHRVNAVMLRGTAPDTVRLPLGVAMFKNEWQVPDTLRVLLQLP